MILEGTTRFNEGPGVRVDFVRCSFCRLQDPSCTSSTTESDLIITSMDKRTGGSRLTVLHFKFSFQVLPSEFQQPGQTYQKLLRLMKDSQEFCCTVSPSGAGSEKEKLLVCPELLHEDQKDRLRMIYITQQLLTANSHKSTSKQKKC